MKDLPLALILEKNKVATSSAWLLLIEVTFPSDVSPDKLYLANNNEDVVFEGQTYTASSFDLSVVKQEGNSKLSSLTLRIVNVDRLIQQKVEEYNGALGAVVKLIVVNTSYLNPVSGDKEKYKELERVYDVIGCTTDAYWATFTLGAPNPLQVRMPLFKYSPVYCQWKFKGSICRYTGTYATCDHSLENCKQRNNQARFGGHIGMNDKAYSFRI